MSPTPIWGTKVTETREKFGSADDFVGYHVNKPVRKEIETLFEEGRFYSKSEVLDILGYPHNIIGWIKLWNFQRHDYFANYWKCYNLRHSHQGYYWKYYDWVGW